MAQIIWTMRAADDLEEIAQYIALDKPDAAANFVGTVIHAVDKLADFPQMGRVVPELCLLRYREVIVAPCRIIYTPEKDAVIIQRVIRGERQIHAGLISQ